MSSGGDIVLPSQMLKGVLEGCILNIIKMEETYGYEISKKLMEFGLGSISEGTIYPILLRLTKNKLLNAELRVSSKGPKRKYYSLTEKGIEEAALFMSNWKILSKSVDLLIQKGEENNEKK